MNSTGPGLIDAVGLAAIRASLRSVLTDPDATVLATLRTPLGAPTVDYAAGTVTPDEATDTVRGLLLVLTEREVAASGGLYQVGDQRLRVMAADVSTQPTTATTVQVGNDRYAVLSVSRSVLPDLHHHLILRKRA